MEPSDTHSILRHCFYALRARFMCSAGLQWCVELEISLDDRSVVLTVCATFRRLRLLPCRACTVEHKSPGISLDITSAACRISRSIETKSYLILPRPKAAAVMERLALDHLELWYISVRKRRVGSKTPHRTILTQAATLSFGVN